ncbi:phage tail tape measure protein [Flavobacterium sp.]|uniref:phage tail tape measure protein n=1 Tax=Flavobacterium sp. TaxID=239 RepID=UPI0037525694
MAKTLTDEDIKLNIIINGNTAQKELFDLEKSTRKLTEENKGLLLQKRLLEKQGKQESEQYKLLTATIKENSSSINQNKIKMNELQKEIGITGLTMKQLSDRANILKLSLRNTIPGSEAHQKYTAELTQITGRINELNGKAKTAGFSISSMADSFNKYSALGATVIAGLTGVVLSVQKIIDINGKLSDAQADVMKTTGMTKTEVDELTKSFGMLETRTSRIDLLKIAEQGGRLGVPKAEIQDFVKTMNMAAVSLGDSFTGGVDEVAEKLGKIKFLFKETKDMGVEEAYNSIGSAINDLGANGTASEANIAEFTKRIGSLTDVLKPTVQETLALGTAFEESGIEAETSSRAYNIFMKQASTESSKFAKVMGISKKAVEDMIDTNPMDFMLQFSKGMNGMNATEVAKTLDYLGINADGANKVIGAMGNNFERFHELIDLSNNSFASGSSLINEYNIKNETLGATLEKISKRISGLFSSEEFINFLSKAVQWISKFIGASEDADGSVTAWRSTLVFLAKVIAIVTAALITNTAWQRLCALSTKEAWEASKLYTIGEKARAFATGITTIATQAQALAVALATGNTIAAKEAVNALTLAMKTTPWGFILSALAAVAVAYVAFSDKVSIAAEVQKTLADIHTEATKSIAKEKSELELLTRVSQDETISKEKRLEAIKKLNDIIPDYIGTLTLENIKNQEGINILKKYTEEIYKNARARAVQSKYDKLIEEKVGIESKPLSEYQSSTSKFFSGDKAKDFTNEDDIKKAAREFTLKLNGSNGKKIVENSKEFYSLMDLTFNNMKSEVQSYLDDKAQELALKDAQIKALEPEITKDTVANLGKDKPAEKSNYIVPGGKEDGKAKAEKKDPNSTDEEIARLKYENDAKYKDLLLKAQRQFEDDKLATMADGYEKELLLENQRYQREISDLEKQKVHTDELVKLDEDIAKAKEAKDIKKYNALIEIKKGWGEKNKNIDDQINKIEEGKLALHNLKLGKIEDDAATKKLADSKKAYDREKALRETQFIDELNGVTTLAQAKEKLKNTLSGAELAQIKTLSQAKKELQDQFNEKELVKQKEHLLDLVAQLNTIMTSKSFKGIDLEFLTPEMREEFQKQIEDLKRQIAELNKVIEGNDEEDAEKKKKARQERIAKIVSDAQAIVTALMNTWSAYYDYMAAKENAQLKVFTIAADKKKVALKRQLDAGYISQTQYNRKVAKIDKEVDDKKFEIELKQAKRKKAMDIVNTVINTAVAIMQAYGQLGPIGGTIAAVLIGAMGALQIATISSTALPVKGYEDGLYPEEVTRQQDGKKFRSSGTSKMQTGLFTKPRILVGEGPGDTPEMVIDKRSYAQISPQVKEALIRELNGVRGFEKGYYKNDVLYSGNTSPVAPTSNNNESKIMEMAMGMMAENMSLMKDLRENGLIAQVSNKDLKSMKNLKDGISDFEALRNKNKN